MNTPSIFERTMYVGQYVRYINEITETNFFFYI